MQEMDCVEVIVEKEAYTKDGVHKGMQGWICHDEFVNGTWLVNFPQCGEKADIATISVKEMDLKLLDHMDAQINEQIRLQYEKEQLNMSKKTAILDLTGCQYIGELHQRIKEALDFPEHYGCNWDAFWDSINCDCDVDIVTIVGSDKVADELKSSVNTMIEIMEENKQFWADTNYPFEYIVAD